MTSSCDIVLFTLAFSNVFISDVGRWKRITAIDDEYADTRQSSIKSRLRLKL